MPEAPELDFMAQYMNKLAPMLHNLPITSFFADVTRRESESPACPVEGREDTGEPIELTLDLVLDMQMKRGGCGGEFIDSAHLLTRG